jgi:hypothetical protein
MGRKEMERTENWKNREKKNARSACLLAHCDRGPSAMPRSINFASVIPSNSEQLINQSANHIFPQTLYKKGKENNAPSTSVVNVSKSMLEFVNTLSNSSSPISFSIEFIKSEGLMSKAFSPECVSFDANALLCESSAARFDTFTGSKLEENSDEPTVD